MAEYRYRAVDEKGEAVDGVMAEDSARRVTIVLQERGLQVNEVELVQPELGILRRQRALTWDELHLFNEHLLSVTKSGMPLAPALGTLASDLRSRRMRGALEGIKKELESGLTLSEAVARYPDSFPRLYVDILRAGERTSNLPGVLQQLHSYSGRMIEFKHTIQESLAYPMLLVVCTFFVMWLFMAKIVPSFAEVFAGFGAALPAMTQFVIDISTFASNSPIALPVALGLVVVTIPILYRFMRAGGAGYTLDWIRLQMWVTGPIYMAGAMGRFCRTLALMLASGVPAPEALRLASAAADNLVLRDAALDAAAGVETGEPLARALESTGFFARSFCWMLGLGEERGDPATVLNEMAESYEQALKRRGVLFRTVAGPLVIFLMAGLVGFVMIALYLPLMTISDAISGG